MLEILVLDSCDRGVGNENAGKLVVKFVGRHDERERGTPCPEE
jgi:hypothetical protein